MNISLTFPKKSAGLSTCHLVRQDSQDSQDTRRREWHKSSSFGASSSETSDQMVGYKIPYPDTCYVYIYLQNLQNLVVRGWVDM